jgi:hypothetical protein
MAVEIRELVLQARILGDDADTSSKSSDDRAGDVSELKAEILEACDRMIRNAFEQRRGR